MLAIRVGMEESLANELAQTAIRALNRNNRHRQEIFDRTVIHQGQHLFNWSHPSHDNTITKITKGLYFHVTNEILPATIPIHAYWFHTLPTGMEEMLEQRPFRTVGNNQFAYSYLIAAEDHTKSIWLYKFYEQHFCGAKTNLE